MDKSIAVTVYLPELLHAKISSVSKADRRSMSNAIVLAVEQFIAQPANVPKWSTNRGAGPGQVHIEDAIAAAVKRGPAKSAKHK